MIMEWLKTVPWEHPGIVGPVAVALTTGVLKLLKREKPSDGGAANVNATVNPEITVAPETKIESNPSNVFEPTVNVGLDEKAVGQEVGKAVDPLRQEIKALKEQLATAQDAPKQKVPDSDNPLKVYAVEFFNAGVDAYMEGENDQAIGHWFDAVTLEPSFTGAHYNLGNALATRGRLGASIEHYKAALRIEPDHANAHLNLGVALAANGESGAAMKHYNAALQIEPDFAGAHTNLGVAMKANGDLNAAIEHYHAALRIDPDLAPAHSNLGVALVAKGEFDMAIKHHNAAIQIDPDLADAHFNLGCAQAQKMAAPAAVAALAKAIVLAPRCRADARSDSDYDPIRDDQAFRKLVYGV